jgi:hypothetical protein
MKTQLTIETPNAGVVRVLPDSSPETRSVVLHFLSDVTMTQRTAAAQYLFDEGFIEFADGQIDLDRLTMDQ